MLATEVIYEAENGLLPEADVAIASNPANAVAVKSTAASPFRAQWLQEREELAAQVTTADATYQNHPGFKEWDSYIASDSCKAMMKRLNTKIFTGITASLGIHWDLFWPGRITDILVREFRAKAKVELVIATLVRPTESQPLTAFVITSDSQNSYRYQEFSNFQAVDQRFTFGKPVIFVSWDNISPWSIIVPDQGYWQLGTFWVTDEKGEVWDSGQVISQDIFKNVKKPEFQKDFLILENAFVGVKETLLLSIEHAVLKSNLEILDKKIAAWSKVSLPESQLVELMRRAEMFAKGDPAAPRGLLLTGPSGTGKSLIASSVAASLNANFQKLSVPDLKQASLGASGQRVREIWNHARQNQPAVIFLDECEGILGQRGAATTDVVASEIVQAFLAEWDGRRDTRIWVIGATNRRDLIDDAIISRFGWEMVIGLPGAEERQQILEREMQAVAQGCVVPEEMASLTQGMSGRDLQHLASHIRTLAYPGMPTEEHFLEAVKASRKAHNTKVDQQAGWDTLVLGPRVLQQLKLTCSLLHDAETWRAQGVDVPRSLLLTGPPGTGKTQIGRTLANEGGLAFVAATTADVKANFLGQSGNQVKLLFQRARTQAPVILFLDELDIIAPARVGANDPLTVEIVGQLLQEMDGIQAQENQVFLLAATNHPENVDRAILSRFRETVVIPLPDEDARRRLLSIMLEKKRLAFSPEEHLSALVARTEGMSARDLKNYVGRAEQNALLRAMNNGGPQHFALQFEDFG